jgi:hypothetical protein
MCLYPRIVINPKYKPNQKNRGVIPPLKDPRTKYVPVGCQKCMECKKKKAREWTTRLMEDIRIHKNAKFVTLTFSNKDYIKLADEIKDLEGYELDNEICRIAVKRFRENWRVQNGKSPRHWLTTEIGGTRYEKIHLHGFIYTDNIKEIEKKWKYGYVFIGKYVNEASINYMTKYVHKTDQKHKEYNSIILTSPGIGKGYINRPDAKKKRIQRRRNKRILHNQNRTQTKLTYVLQKQNIYRTGKRRTLDKETRPKHKICKWNENRHKQIRRRILRSTRKSKRT